MRINKKAQFGPDFIIAMVMVIIVGLGGVLFLHIYVGGLSMQGLLSVLDTESDQKCFSILNAMVGDEYMTSGENVEGVKYFGNLSDYYGGIQPGSQRSLRFEERMDAYKTVATRVYFRPGGISDMEYYLASRKTVKELRNQFAANHQNDYNEFIFCSTPVYGPYESGVAELFIKER